MQALCPRCRRDAGAMQAQCRRTRSLPNRFSNGLNCVFSNNFDLGGIQTFVFVMHPQCIRFSSVLMRFSSFIIRPWFGWYWPFLPVLGLNVLHSFLIAIEAVLRRYWGDTHLLYIRYASVFNLTFFRFCANFSLDGLFFQISQFLAVRTAMRNTCVYVWPGL